MKYASGGNLHSYLKNNFTDLTWNKKKLYILWQISEGYLSYFKYIYILLMIVTSTNLLTYLTYFILALKIFTIQTLYTETFTVVTFYLTQIIQCLQDIDGKLEI